MCVFLLVSSVHKHMYDNLMLSERFWQVDSMKASPNVVIQRATMANILFQSWHQIFYFFWVGTAVIEQGCVSCRRWRTDSGIQGMRPSWWCVCTAQILPSLPDSLPLYRWISVCIRLLWYADIDWHWNGGTGGLWLAFDLRVPEKPKEWKEGNKTHLSTLARFKHRIWRDSEAELLVSPTLFDFWRYYTPKRFLSKHPESNWFYVWQTEY